MPAGQQRGRLAGEVPHRIEPGPAVERDVHVEAVAPGGADVSGQAQLVLEQLTCPQRGLAHLAEVLAVGRIEVKNQLVRRVELIRAAGEGVHFDAGLAGQVDEVRGLAAHRVLQHAALLGHADPADPVREVGGDIFCTIRWPARPSG